MKSEDIKNILNKLEIEANGTYENQFYKKQLENSDDYARTYSKLDKVAVNTEYPSINTNTNKTTTKVTNYFEMAENNTTYTIFLIADFDTDTYYLKIGQI